METKSLYIVRHGKAEDHSLLKKDFDRNLIDRGIARATATAGSLKKSLSEIDQAQVLILSSTANRAAQTARIVAEVLGYPAEAITWEPGIYEAHYLQLMKRVNDISANYSHVIIVGHNPGLSDLVDYIADEYINLKTAYIACLRLEEGLDYSSLSANTADLEKIIAE